MYSIISAIKAAFKANDDKRDSGLSTPDDIERWDDIQYGSDPKWQVLDVYRPRNATGPLPVIVSFHGGGWVYGDKERYQYYCMDLAQRGFAVVNFTYRLAPESRFPSSLADTCLVFRWLQTQKDCSWFDLGRLFAVGDSAGGHLLATYCAICHRPDYAKAIGVEPAICPTAVALNCGVYDIDMNNVGNLRKEMMKAFLKGQGNDSDEVSLVNPVNYMNEDFPRAFVMTANNDSMAGPPAQRHLVSRLRSFNVEVIDKTYGDADHQLGHVFHVDIRNPLGRQCNDDECRWFLEG